MLWTSVPPPSLHWSRRRSVSLHRPQQCGRSPACATRRRMAARHRLLPLRRQPKGQWQPHAPPGITASRDSAIALFHALSGSGAVACVDEETALVIGPSIDFHDVPRLKELRDAGVDDKAIRLGPTEDRVHLLRPLPRSLITQPLFDVGKPRADMSLGFMGNALAHSPPSRCRNSKNAK